MLGVCFLLSGSDMIGVYVVWSSSVVRTAKLGAFFDEHDALAFLMSSGLCLVTIFDNSKLQLGPIIKSCKFQCQTRVLLMHVSLVSKMSAFKFICFVFSFSHAAAFGFLVSIAQDNNILIAAHKKAWLAFTGFLTGICAAAETATWRQNSSFLMPELSL